MQNKHQQQEIVKQIKTNGRGQRCKHIPTAGSGDEDIQNQEKKENTVKTNRRRRRSIFECEKTQRDADIQLQNRSISTLKTIPSKTQTHRHQPQREARIDRLKAKRREAFLMLLMP